MDDSMIWLLVLIPAIVIALRLLAGMRNPVGRIFRFIWNTSFKIVSIIPFMGWMTHFIIAETKSEKRAKQEYVDAGRRVDSRAVDYVERESRRKMQEDKEYHAAQEAERAKREEYESSLRARCYQKFGTDDVQLSRHGTKVRVDHDQIYPVEEFERMLRS